MLSIIHPTWKPLFDKWNTQIQTIFTDVYNLNTDKITFPPQEIVFKAFEMDLAQIKICLIGQDCYHGDKQAMGLAFSVSNTAKIPPSLANIFKELQIEFPDRNYKFTHGDLTKWMQNEHIFLLNCALTVEKGKPLSHISKWTAITDDIIKYLATNNKNCIFLLLGNYAKE
jgi:uracil-DNA glycosylase